MTQTIEEWEEENEIHPDPGQAIMDLEMQLAAAEQDRDFYRTESETHKKAWEEATAVLGERSVENAELKTLIGELIHYLALGTGFNTDGHAVDQAATILYKYSKKEEPKP